MQRFDKPAEKSTVASVAEVLFDDGDKPGTKRGQELRGGEIRSSDVVQTMLCPMNHGGFEGIVVPEGGEICCQVGDFSFERHELKGEVEGGGKISQSSPGGGKEIGIRSDSGDSNGFDQARTRREDVEQSWPLEPLHDVEIDDVEAGEGADGLEDGLIGGEV